MTTTPQRHGWPTKSAQHARGMFLRCAWMICGALLCAAAMGCTREVETGHPPVVIAMADLVVPPRPALPKAVEEPPVTPPVTPETQELLIDPAPLFEQPSLHETCVAALLPSAEEDRWLETAWRTDLLRARREANATGRPMFMWLMDGNPLGCT